jgi:hypothetical protein
MVVLRAGEVSRPAMEEEKVMKTPINLYRAKATIPATSPIAADKSEISNMRNDAGGESAARVPSFAVAARIESADTATSFGTCWSRVLMDACCSFLCREAVQSAAD